MDLCYKCCGSLIFVGTNFRGFSQGNVYSWAVMPSRLFVNIYQLKTHLQSSFYFPTFSCFHRALTVRSLCVHLSSPLRSVCAHRAFTKRSPWVHRSFSIHTVYSVFIHFHSELQNKRIGLCESQQNEKRNRA